MTVWEYHAVAIETTLGAEGLAKAFNKEASEGWELIEIVPLAKSTLGGKTHAAVYKRPKKAEQ